MKNITKWAGAIALAASVCMITGCTSGDTPTADSTSSSAGTAEGPDISEYLAWPPLEIEPLSQTPEPGLKVTVVNCTVTSCWPGELARAGELLGWDVTEVSYDLAKGPSDYVAAVDRALQTEPDALAILPVYPLDMIQEQLDQAQSNGVTLVDLGSGIDEPPAGFISCVSCNPALRAMSALTADVVAADAGGPTSVGIMHDKSIPIHTLYAETAVDQLKKYSPDTQTEDIEVSFSRTPDANAAAVISALQRNPNIKYLYSVTPDMVSGLPQALNAAGLGDAVKIVAFAPDSQQLKLVDGGGVFAWVGTDGPVAWWRVADAIARNEVGDEVDATPLPSLRVVTEENFDPGMFAPPDYEAAYEEAWGLG